jgi:hypothetical protein
MKHEAVFKEYLREVGHHLRDVPAKQRKLLLEEASANLADIPAGMLGVRLPDAATFAAELRDAAGFPIEGGPVARLRALPKGLLVVGIVAVAAVGIYLLLAVIPVRFTPGSLINPGTASVEQGPLGETGG